MSCIAPDPIIVHGLLSVFEDVVLLVVVFNFHQCRVSRVQEHHNTSPNKARPENVVPKHMVYSLLSNSEVVS